MRAFLFLPVVCILAACGNNNKNGSAAGNRNSDSGAANSGVCKFPIIPPAERTGPPVNLGAEDKIELIAHERTPAQIADDIGRFRNGFRWGQQASPQQFTGGFSTATKMTAIIDLYKKVTVPANTRNYITGAKFYMGMTAQGTLQVLFQPVYLVYNNQLDGGENPPKPHSPVPAVYPRDFSGGSYDVKDVASTKYYRPSADGNTMVEAADGADLIRKYQNPLGGMLSVKDDYSATFAPFINAGTDANGDTKYALFTFQEIVGLYEQNHAAETDANRYEQNLNIAHTAAYYYSKDNPGSGWRLKNEFDLSVDLQSGTRGIRTYSFVGKGADLPDLCPPRCGYVTYNLLR